MNFEGAAFKYATHVGNSKEFRRVINCESGGEKRGEKRSEKRPAAKIHQPLAANRRLIYSAHFVCPARLLILSAQFISSADIVSHILCSLLLHIPSAHPLWSSRLPLSRLLISGSHLLIQSIHLVSAIRLLISSAGLASLSPLIISSAPLLPSSRLLSSSAPLVDASRLLIKYTHLICTARLLISSAQLVGWNRRLMYVIHLLW